MWYVSTLLVSTDIAYCSRRMLENIFFKKHSRDVLQILKACATAKISHCNNKHLEIGQIEIFAWSFM